MGRLSTPKIRTSVTQIAANCIFEVLDFKIFRGRTPGTPKNAVTDYLHVEFSPPNLNQFLRLCIYFYTIFSVSC